MISFRKFADHLHVSCADALTRDSCNDRCFLIREFFKVTQYQDFPVDFGQRLQKDERGRRSLTLPCAARSGRQSFLSDVDGVQQDVSQPDEM